MFKIVIKAILFGGVLGLVCVAGMAVVNRLQTNPRYNIEFIEVRGTQRTDISKLKELYLPMVGQNVFREISASELMSDDPWIEKLEIRRVIPNKLVVKVKEEKELLRYKTGNACVTLVASGAKIAISCDGIRVTVTQTPLASEFEEFLKLYNSNDLFQNSEVVLKKGFFTLTNRAVTFVSSYDADTFKNNYETFVSRIEPRYKAVERVDITVPGKVFVKGVING